MKKRRFIYAVLVLGILTIGFMLPILLGWDEFCCLHTDIDIYTGDVRKQRYIAFMKVSESVTPTKFSNLVREMLDDRNEEPVWMRVETTETLFYRVYIYSPWHGSIRACEFFVRYVEETNVPEARKRELLKQCLSDLRNGDLRSFYDRLDKDMQQHLLDSS
jgi:hypothetical protein